MKSIKKLVVGVLIASVLLQPLGLVTPVLAETVRMEYSDPNHIHAPKVVSVCSSALQCASDDYQYDANGNLTFDGERKIGWNQDNLPVRIEKGGQVVEFFYDANGRRIVKQIGQEGANRTVYVNQYYEQLTINNEQSSAKYYFANGRVAVRNTPSGGTPTLTYLHQDHLGSTVLATDTNSQPTSESLSYFPYGSSISNQQLAISNYLFTGQELDDEASLYNYNARLYNPRTGVFISADSVSGGNRYAYAANNPMVFVDPSGNQVNAWYWLTKIVAGGGRLGTSFFSGTFWAGVATWAGGVYAEAYAKYVQDQGFMPPLTPYEVGWYEPTPVDLSEEEYNRWVNSARATQEAGKGIAELSAWGYLLSAGVRLAGEEQHRGPIDREKTLGVADDIIQKYSLDVKLDESAKLGPLVGGTYNPQTRTIAGPPSLMKTPHELGHAVEHQVWGTLPGLPEEVLSTKQFYTEHLPFAIENEVAADAFASREMFGRGENLYGFFYDLRATLDPMIYTLYSFAKYHDYWTRTIQGPR